MPVQISDENGHVIRDENALFGKWKSDLENLYICNANDDFDQIFYGYVKPHKFLLENDILAPLSSSNTNVNHNISVDEVSIVIMNAKKMWYCGTGKIP